MRPVHLDVTAADIEAHLGEVSSERAAAWRAQSEKRREKYVAHMREYGGDPPELLALLDNPLFADAWSLTAWLAQREYCRHVNHGRTAPERRYRAAATLRVLTGADPGDVPATGPWSWWGTTAASFGAPGILSLAAYSWWSLMLLVPAALCGARWYRLRSPYARSAPSTTPGG